MTGTLAVGLGALLVLVGAGTLRWLIRVGEAAQQADWGGRWTNRMDGWIRLFCRRYHRLRPGAVHLPAHGGAIVVANHVSGLDPLLLIAACRRPLRFLIAREQYERYGLRWLFRLARCIPVDRAVRPERALREALRALRAGEVVALFPHGAIHVRRAPPPLKRGVASLSRITGCPVYPVRLDGIRAQGHVVAAVWVRSHARVHTFAPLRCESGAEAQFLADLAHLLDGHAPRGHATTTGGPPRP